MFIFDSEKYLPMKRLLLPLFVASALVAGAAIMAAGPNIEFVKTTHDFGKIPQGKPVAHEFEFTNTGDEPLLLIKVKASCGCTTPSYPREPIAPGESAKIKAVYNAASAGRFQKSVTVTTNIKEADNSTDKRINLFIKGEVVSDNLNKGNGGSPQSPVRINN